MKKIEYDPSFERAIVLSPDAAHLLNSIACHQLKLMEKRKQGNSEEAKACMEFIHAYAEAISPERI